MTLELLPNELIVDIFKYLKTVDIIRAFYNLQTRFDGLIFVHLQEHQFNFELVSKNDFDIVCEQYLPLISDRICSLYLSNDHYIPQQIERFIFYSFEFRGVSQLRKLILNNLHCKETMKKLLFSAHCLVHLTYLTITNSSLTEYDKEEINDFIDTIWSLPKLTYCYLGICFGVLLRITELTQVSSSLEHLFMPMPNACLTLEEIALLFKYTPRLRSFHVHEIADGECNQIFSSGNRSLRKLEISRIQSKPTLIRLLQNIPNLFHLKIGMANSFFDGYQWKQIIANNVPQLKILEFKMDSNFGYFIKGKNEIDRLVESFQDRFWIDEHQWFVQCCWNPNRYSNYSLCLHTLPYTLNKFILTPDNSNNYRQSTGSYDRSYDGVKKLYYDLFIFDDVREPYLRFSHIRQLEIKLPFDDRFSLIVPNLDRLVSLIVEDTFEEDALPQIQVLIDQSPRLYSLKFKTLVSAVNLHLPAVRNTNESIRRIDLGEFNHVFSGEECMALCHLLSCLQCEILTVKLDNLADVLELFERIVSLRAMTVILPTEKFNENDGSVAWLQYRLTPKYSVRTNDPYTMQIFICGSVKVKEMLPIS